MIYATATPENAAKARAVVAGVCDCSGVIDWPSRIGLLAYRTWVDFGRSSEQVEISRQIVDGANALLSSLRDAETGQRGFLLTGRDQYLEPYRQAITEVPNTVEKLTNITAARRPDQAERLNRLRPLVKDKLDELGETILVRR